MTDHIDNTNHTEDFDDGDEVVEVKTESKVREATPYEKRLRNERAKERTARQAAEQALVTAKSEADQRVADAHKSFSDRIIRSEVKAHAVQAGLVDIDALALIDLSKCTLDEHGSVTNAAEAIAAAKKAKPYLFSGSATSSTSPTPRSEAVKDFDARTASPAEILVFERKMGLRQ